MEGLKKILAYYGINQRWSKWKRLPPVKKRMLFIPLFRSCANPLLDYCSNLKEKI